MIARFFACVLGLAVAVLAAGPAAAQSGALPADQPKVVASLIPERKAIAPGETVTIALHEAIRKNWHTYWINPGDAGAATTIAWHLPPGWTAGAISWPYPKRLPVAALMDFGYEDEVSLLVDVTAPKDAAPGTTAMLGADVMWLVCNDVCIPEQTHLNLPVRVAASSAPPDDDNRALFTAARARLPHASPWKAIYDAGDKRFALLVESPALASAGARMAEFYPAQDGLVENAAVQAVGTSPRGLVLQSITGWKMKTADKRNAAGDLSGVLVLTGADGRTDALEITAAPGVVPATEALFAQTSGIGLWQAILFAFLGGLILNLMPCVFPVLSMKALALAGKAAAPKKAKIAALSYGAGVLVSFAALAGVLIALRDQGAAIGWGFQLQQPGFVTALALVMLAVGLNLSGLYEIGGGLSGVGGKLADAGGARGSFFTGVLAVLVATPCTAPFMAAGMGFALTASGPVAMAVFLALGAGFALPFVLLGFWPALLRALPRPGPWMVRLRRILAVPMYGAALWLVWVLSQQAGSNAVAAVLAAGSVFGFGLWTYGRSKGDWTGKASAAIAVIVVAGAIGFTARQTPPAASADNPGALAYQPYSAARLAALRAEGRPVFVNATAAWCITCLVNERMALSGDHLARTFADKHIAALKADWTNRDSEITQLLAAEGRSGVPLYLYFAPHAEKAVVLPQILTESGLIAAMGSAS